MSKKCDTVMEILQRKGTDQLLRNKFELDPASIELMDFDLEDWMKFAYNLAKHLNYFSEENSKIPDGDWQSFFKDNDDLKELLDKLEETNSLTPHLTLFICFLRLLDFSKDRFNKITKRHLDYFYTEILQIEKIPAQSDKAYVVFELAKSFDQEKLEKGLGLDGGKDANGVKRIYELTEELVANKAQVAALKNVYYHEKNASDKGADANYYMRSSSVANSYDGEGEAFPGEDVSWLPFGYYQDEEVSEEEKLDYPKLQKAKIGFSLAADILDLSEGERHVQFSIDFRDVFASDEAPSFDELKESIQVFYTVKNKWEGPLELSEESGVTGTDLPSTLFLGNIAEETPITIKEYTTRVFGNRAELYVKLETKNEPTAPYDPEIHLGNLGDKKPVFRFMIDVNTESGQKVFKAFSKAIVACGIQVEVQGMRDLVLDTDVGKLNPTKPGYPFTTNPVVGSNFIVDKDEIFNKNWSSVEVQIKWQNTPDNFEDWYAAYQEGLESNLSRSIYANSQTEHPPVVPPSTLPTITNLPPGTDLTISPVTDSDPPVSTSPEVPELNLPSGISVEDIVNAGINLGRAQAPTELPRKPNTPGDNKIVGENSYFTAIQYIKKNNQWTNVTSGNVKVVTTNLFEDITDAVNDGLKFECKFKIPNPTFSTDKEYVGPVKEYAGPVKLTLNSSFFHDIYPQLYAIAMSSNDPNQIIPNKPYTPFCQEVVVSYVAKEVVSIGSTKESDFVDSAITLFHEKPFGHAVEHAYLRELHKTPKTPVESCSLVPRMNYGGELYIGLENAKPLQTVSLFVQLLEGSENPLAESFDKDEIRWEVLCSDFWKPLNSIAIKMNEIDNFLKSGLVRFEIPKEATDDNIQLDQGLIWVKAIMPKSFDSVCRVLEISAQGAMAEFVDNGNELSHLEAGLPAETISKLEDRIPSVKSVVQPYNTFDGKPEETDAAYYKRVSERIRHKNRAIMLWDYENIVLQEFPDIYRVKCLNHTNSKSLLAAGSVTLAVVPDTVGKNMFNILQPRVSKAYLNKIKAYVSQLTSLHVNLDVINPQYEEVMIYIHVKFYDQFDKSLYERELNQDLKKFLSPWAFEEAKNVEFGVTLHQSVLIDYVERLPYVDYITSIKMEVGPVGKKGVEMKNARPSSPKSILVSKEEHDITVLTVAAESQSSTESEC